jgi:hypothetical protein
MENRVLMAKFTDAMKMRPHESAYCSCGTALQHGETVMLYPIPEFDGGYLRDVVCLTCHFWFVHEVQSELEA